MLDIQADQQLLNTILQSASRRADIKPLNLSLIYEVKSLQGFIMGLAGLGFTADSLHHLHTVAAVLPEQTYATTAECFSTFSNQCTFPLPFICPVITAEL